MSYRKAGTAVICVDRLPHQWDGDTVTVANEKGAYDATRYLLQLGHRKLATITGPLQLTNARQRLAGFKRVVHDAMLKISSELRIRGSIAPPPGKAGEKGLHRAR